jgi:hypothetical protein
MVGKADVVMNCELGESQDTCIPATKKKLNVKGPAIRHPVPRLSLKDSLRIQTLYAIAPSLMVAAPKPPI